MVSDLFCLKLWKIKEASIQSLFQKKDKPNLNKLKEEEGSFMILEIKNNKRLSEIIGKCKKEKYEGDNYSLLS